MKLDKKHYFSRMLVFVGFPAGVAFGCAYGIFATMADVGLLGDKEGTL